VIGEVVDVEVAAVLHLGHAVEIGGEDGSGCRISGDHENSPCGVDMDANAWIGRLGDFHGCQGVGFRWLWPTGQRSLAGRHQVCQPGQLRLGRAQVYFEHRLSTQRRRARGGVVGYRYADDPSSYACGYQRSAWGG
jgi:hypothetical protein